MKSNDLEVIDALTVWLEQYPDPIGVLRSYSDESIEFAYSGSHLIGGESYIPLSLSMPVKDGPYGDVETRAYFNNLLQENSQLDYIRDKYSLPANDIVGLLGYLGADLPGAISCLSEEAGPVKRPGLFGRDYDILSLEKVEAIVESLHDKRALPIDTKDPSPLAGVQRKYALCYDEEQGQFFLPKEGENVPTTHIIKVPGSNDKRDVELEEKAMLLADSIGLDTAFVVARKTRKDIPYLLIERFDRVITNEGEIYRLHQEDFAQAIGVPARFKYERDGISNKYQASVIYDILLQTDALVTSLEAFLKLTFFNLAIGNNDNHAKNHGLLYMTSAKPEFAPAYDLLPILLNDGYTKELAFKIGNASTITEITYLDVMRFFEAFKMSEAAANRFLVRCVKPMYEDIFIKMDDVKLPKDFRDLIGACIAHLSAELKLEIKTPEFFDYFPLEEKDKAWRAG